MAAVTFYTIEGGVDTYWRAELATRVLDAKWIRVPSDLADRAFTEPNRDTPFTWYPVHNGKRFFPDRRVAMRQWAEAMDFVEYPMHEGDHAVWTRPDALRAKHALAMENRGVTTVAEVDDNYLSNPHLNIFMRMRVTPRDQMLHMLSFFSMHKNVFSTEWLRDEYMAFFRRHAPRSPDGKRLAPPQAFVCHNHVDVNDWPVLVPYDGPPRVGWMGSPQHYRDVKLGYGALRLAKDMNCPVYMVGANFADEEGVTNPKALEVCRTWGYLLARQVPWVDPEKYHRSELPFDIGIIPLELNKHTMGKSDVKALEYTISGAAVLAQNHPVYNKYWKHNETCLLANSPEEFGKMMYELIKHPALRHRLVDAAQEYVRQERTMQVQGREEWQAVLTT